jgi:hypothetical protein
MIKSVTSKVLRFLFVCSKGNIKKYLLFSQHLNPNDLPVSSNYKNNSIFIIWHSSFLLGCSLSISCACIPAELFLFGNIIHGNVF